MQTRRDRFPVSSLLLPPSELRYNRSNTSSRVPTRRRMTTAGSWLTEGLRNESGQVPWFTQPVALSKRLPRCVKAVNHPHRGGRRRRRTAEGATGIKEEGGEEEEEKELLERQEEEEVVQEGSVVGQSLCHTDHQVCAPNIERHIRTATEGREKKKRQ